MTNIIFRRIAAAAVLSCAVEREACSYDIAPTAVQQRVTAAYKPHTEE